MKDIEYKKLSNIDISLSKNEDIVNASFTPFIVDCVRKILDKYTSKWFLEYSVVASTIDPQINKLRCISIVNGDQKFATAIEKYIRPIISVLSEESGDDWWFHNPETFILPSKYTVAFPIS